MNHIFPKRPEPFQGDILKESYFEGWFYKLVTKDRSRVISIIPGISTGDINNPPKSFIQINDTINGTLWKCYSTDNFSAKNDKLEIKIEKNYFSDRELKLESVIDGISIIGKVFFQGIKPYPQTKYAPSIMGPFYYIPNMQCNHAVVSMSHNLMGHLTINGEIVDFTGGEGYIEKDWGTSFPKSWLWIQGNSFDRNGTSFMLSVAHIPLGKTEFTGIISFFYHKGKMLNISTYNGAKIIESSKENDVVSTTITNGRYTLNLLCNQMEKAILKSPIKGNMSETVEESLNSVLHLSIIYNHSGQCIYEGSSTCCGCEVGGQMFLSK